MTELKAKLRRLGVYGDLPSRFMNWGVRRCPYFLEPVFLAGYTTIFYLICGRARRAVAENLTTLLPGSIRWINELQAWRVFWNFAQTMTDAAHCSLGREAVDWDIEGLRHFEQIAGLDSGALILTAHMGNYDIAAPFFADRFNRRVNAVRAPERQVERQAQMKASLEKQVSENFAVRYNEPGGMIGIELAQALARKELVAIQGDRVMFQVAPVEAEFDAATKTAIALPKGPFALAMSAGVPICPLFVIRLSRRRYRIRIGEPFEIRRGRGPDGKDAALAGAAERWLDALGPVIRTHWDQWFVFEPAFRSMANDPSSSA